MRYVFQFVYRRKFDRESVIYFNILKRKGMDHFLIKDLFLTRDVKQICFGSCDRNETVKQWKLIGFKNWN